MGEMHLFGYLVFSMTILISRSPILSWSITKPQVYRRSFSSPQHMIKRIIKFRIILHLCGLF
jgi:hypothetical protein